MSIIAKHVVNQHRCPNCSGPLAAPTSSFAKCPYCDSLLHLPPLQGFRIPEPRRYPQPAGLPLVEVAGSAYGVHGRLARGGHSDVFLARRERALTEMVLLKIARPSGEDGVRREWEALQNVRKEHDYLRHLTCAPILLGQVRSAGQPTRLGAVYRWRSGFSFTFLDARAQYPDGVDPAATVWVWNRILDQLICLQAAGWSHNAVSPEHILLHPRDHGVAFCGWSEAGPGKGDDLARSGECIATLLGSSAPRWLRELARQAADFRDPGHLKQKLRRESEAAFGPPRFQPFILR